ncbi:alcohol dehydrogenase-like protein [Xylona heveae TC161]|uniref:alcohol dehydrogenase (NADP(+)) n=1 Tax=Xylona heveae (strain CBS 132557 / TC161) TaxID=1328760 RepID=A0A165HH92_XYLHT|nr:alcohol dehydrogenase-like protein [Xylona heveae TC161]KZF23513.1 alcohol dehydrogenase-like protein [Xylona heveae TC161]
MVYPDTFEGFQIDGPDTWTEFQKRPFQPKPFGDYDVEIRISACGVCSSDIHTINGGWGERPFPLCVGHEIVGTAIRVGPKVTLIEHGQRVGVGAQCLSCLECKQCKNGNEVYCLKQVSTYGKKYPGTDITTQGGYASHIRAHEYFVFPIPEKLDTAQAAPMLCAGITAYSPLVRHGCAPGSKVGIVGLGGIGHFAVMFAKALGAEVWVISRTRAKEEDARKLGADGFIATCEEEWNEPHRMTFDLVLNTANSSKGFDLNRYLSLLDVHKRFISVGLPEGSGNEIHAKQLLGNGVLMGASHLGNRQEMLEMLQLAADKGVKGWIEEIPISEDGLKLAVTRLHDNDVRYRFVLTEYWRAFGITMKELALACTSCH